MRATSSLLTRRRAYLTGKVSGRAGWSRHDKPKLSADALLRHADASLKFLRARRPLGHREGAMIAVAAAIARGKLRRSGRALVGVELAGQEPEICFSFKSVDLPVVSHEQWHLKLERNNDQIRGFEFRSVSALGFFGDDRSQATVMLVPVALPSALPATRQFVFGVGVALTLPPFTLERAATVERERHQDRQQSEPAAAVVKLNEKHFDELKARETHQPLIGIGHVRPAASERLA